MIPLAIVPILVVLFVIAIPALAMIRNGKYDKLSFGCLGFLGVFALAIIFVGTTLFI